ncbi:hypothetical protein, partial [Pseudomonas sp.]|uniref:hypothetical protein n=1 Tax=Pseudomonas sp. TaxID=306 RepID=UPI003FD8795E
GDQIGQMTARGHEIGHGWPPARCQRKSPSKASCGFFAVVELMRTVLRVYRKRRLWRDFNFGDVGGKRGDR